MTIQSYQNYVQNVKYRTSILANDFINKTKIGSCNTCKLEMDLRILTAYIDILQCYSLRDEDGTDLILNYPQKRNLQIVATPNSSPKYYGISETLWIQLVTMGIQPVVGQLLPNSVTHTSGYITNIVYIPGGGTAYIYGTFVITDYTQKYMYFLLEREVCNTIIRVTNSSPTTLNIVYTDYSGNFGIDSHLVACNSLGVVVPPQSDVYSITFAVSNLVVEMTGDISAPTDYVKLICETKSYLYIENCLTIEQMEKIVTHINEILNMSYCVSFNLTGIYN